MELRHAGVVQLVEMGRDCTPEMNAVPWDLSRFRVDRLIGRGYASRVYEARDHATGALMALKVYRKAKLCPLNFHQIRREIRIHASFSHPNILRMHAAFEDDAAIYLALEHCAKGDLYNYLRQRGHALTESQAAKYVVEPFLRTLRHLGEANVIHRDIKPENVLISSNGALKLADFGLSIVSSEELPVTRVGTMAYMSPEVSACPRKAHPGDWKHRRDLAYGAKADVWALGVLVYELVVGRPPHQTGPLEAPDISGVLSPQCESFVRWCLSVDPASRPTVDDLSTHPWVACTVAARSSNAPAARPADTKLCAAALQPAATAIKSSPQVPSTHAKQERVVARTLSASRDGTECSEAADLAVCSGANSVVSGLASDQSGTLGRGSSAALGRSSPAARHADALPTLPGFPQQPGRLSDVCMDTSAPTSPGIASRSQIPVQAWQQPLPTLPQHIASAPSTATWAAAPVAAWPLQADSAPCTAAVQRAMSACASNSLAPALKHSQRASAAAAALRGVHGPRMNIHALGSLSGEQSADHASLSLPCVAEESGLTGRATLHSSPPASQPQPPCAWHVQNTAAHSPLRSTRRKLFAAHDISAAGAHSNSPELGVAPPSRWGAATSLQLCSQAGGSTPQAVLPLCSPNAKRCLQNSPALCASGAYSTPTAALDLGIQQQRASPDIMASPGRNSPLAGQSCALQADAAHSTDFPPGQLRSPARMHCGMSSPHRRAVI